MKDKPGTRDGRKAKTGKLAPRRKEEKNRKGKKR
jgi:hypothetical protein